MAEETKIRRKVKILAFPYYTDEEDPITGKQVRRERIGTRDEVIEVSELDERRGDYYDAFYPKGAEDESESGEAPPTFDAASADDAELQRWIEEDSPTVQDVLNAADGDPTLASRLLDAENRATDNDPRKGVEEGLGAIANR